MGSTPAFDYQGAIEKLRDRYGFDFTAVALVQPAAERFVLTWQYASGNINDRYKRIVLYSGRGLAGIVFKTGKPELIKSVSSELNAQELFNYPIVVAERLKSLAALPLWSNQRVTGVLLVGFRQDHRMTEDMITMLQDSIGQEFGSIYDKEMDEH